VLVPYIHHINIHTTSAKSHCKSTFQSQCLSMLHHVRLCADFSAALYFVTLPSTGYCKMLQNAMLGSVHKRTDTALTVQLNQRAGAALKRQVSRITQLNLPEVGQHVLG
jgi:hypothetical protein